MKRRVPEAIAILAAVAIAVPAAAAQVSVSDAWFRALPSGLPAGGYFTLHNNGRGVQLTGARSSACGMLMLHKSAVNGGMASMTMVTSVDVPAGASVSFAPGGYHLMCTNPSPLLKPGAKIPVTLTFGDGTSAIVDFAVRNANGK